MALDEYGRSGRSGLALQVNSEVLKVCARAGLHGAVELELEVLHVAIFELLLPEEGGVALAGHGDLTLAVEGGVAGTIGPAQ